MSYGLRVINDSSYLQIDSDLPRLCAIHKGTYNSGGDYIAYVTFPSPITTVEPPCIFLRNSESRPNDIYHALRITGSANNWTGFSVEAANVTHRPIGKWFAAVFSSVANSSYGLRLWGSDGSIVYDTGAVPVIVTKANNFWTYAGSITLPTIGSSYYFQNNMVAPIASDEYFMMNPFSRGVLKPQDLGNWHKAGVRYDYSTSRLQMYIVDTGVGPWTDQGDMAAVFARLPGT